jgi:nucleoid-associated protein YgaU
VRFRRRGRHTTPSQVEKVALQAGKAAPAVAIAGALVAGPQASQALAASANPIAGTEQSQPTPAGHTAGTGAHTATATLDAFETRTVTVAAATPARHAAATQSTFYTVRSGDTLSKIADDFYHNANDWQFLFQENAKTISNPDLIFTGERLLVPATAPAHVALTSYAPKHAKPAQPAQAAQPAKPAARTVSAPAQHTVSHSSGGAADGGAAVVQSAHQGMYSCSGLEQLWEQAGGSAAHAFMAAEIAMAESGGNPGAISPTDDFGLWQINGSNGSLATLNALQNAKSAITLSDNGTSWGPWTTFHSGAYFGKC